MTFTEAAEDVRLVFGWEFGEHARAGSQPWGCADRQVSWGTLVRNSGLSFRGLATVEEREEEPERNGQWSCGCPVGLSLCITWAQVGAQQGPSTGVLLGKHSHSCHCPGPSTTQLPGGLQAICWGQPFPTQHLTDRASRGLLNSGWRGWKKLIKNNQSNSAANYSCSMDYSCRPTHRPPTAMSSWPANPLLRGPDLQWRRAQAGLGSAEGVLSLSESTIPR